MPHVKTANSISRAFQNALGIARCIADSGRLEIAFAVSTLAQSAVEPTTRHWQHLKRLIKHLKQTKILAFYFPTPPIHTQHLLHSQTIPMTHLLAAQSLESSPLCTMHPSHGLLLIKKLHQRLRATLNTRHARRPPTRPCVSNGYSPNFRLSRCTTPQLSLLTT